MTNLTFRLDPSDCDENADDMHVLLIEGEDTHISVQDAHRYSGEYVVNHYLYDDSGRLEAVDQVSAHRSLKAAKDAAISYYSHLRC